ncbi:MAG TPA: right-handed parallel beta-helix repeat-containing protein [bacterium]|nr:right-handed parallel beta-helix repeat-containing protein [bacterium]
MKFIKTLFVLIFPLLMTANEGNHTSKGYFGIEVNRNGLWQKVEQVSFSEFESTQKVILPENVSELKFVKNGGGASHIDMIRLDGLAPIGEPLLNSSDKALFHVKGDTVVRFSRPGKNLEIAGRIEPVKIIPFAFDFPKINQFKKIRYNSSFYSYKPGSSQKADDRSVLFNEYTVPGSGHPEGNTVTYVWNDDRYLNVKIDFTPDNTMDGGKDYTAIHIRQGDSVKTFRMSAEDTKWGTPEFKKTANADYPHKVYSYKIPLSELDVDKSGIDMAFSAYGTAAPQLVLTDAGGFDYNFTAYSLNMSLEGNDDYPDYSGSFDNLSFNGNSIYENCSEMTKSEDGRMFTCMMKEVLIPGMTNEVDIKKTVFVPSGKNYVRITTTVSNLNAESISLDLKLENSYLNDTDSSFVFEKTDGSLDDPGAWVAMDTTKTTLARVGEIKYGSGDVAHPVFGRMSNTYMATWAVNIPAGESVTLMTYLTQNTNLNAVTGVLGSLFTQSDTAMFAGLDSKIVNSIINWKLEDTDSDGMIDQWEDANGLDSSKNDSALDKDGDGLTNKEEFDLGSDPDNSDSDSDGINDKTEYDSVPQTSLTASDSDGDGFHDGDEILYGSDPLDDTEYPEMIDGTYFVDPSVKGLGNGTESSPWKSLKYAIKMLSTAQNGTYLLKLADGVNIVEDLSGIEISIPGLTIEGSGNSSIGSAFIYAQVPLITMNGGTIRNVIFESYSEYTDDIGIKVMSLDVAVEDCTFINLDSGVSVEESSDLIVRRSVFIDDNTGVQVISDSSSVKVENCYFASSNLPAAISSMYTAFLAGTTTADITFEHNTVTGFEGNGVDLDGATGNNVIRYNIFDDVNAGIVLENMPSNTTGVHWNFLNNFTEGGIVANNGSLFTSSNNFVNIDPLITENSYELLSTSPAIDAVDDDTDAVVEDIEGKVRPNGDRSDIGCWEYYPEFTVTFAAGENGSIEGELIQTVYSGYDTSAVTAVADTGYEFSGWTGDYSGTENPLVVENVTENMTITAVFALSETPDETTDEAETDNETPDTEIDDTVVPDETTDDNVSDNSQISDEAADDSDDEKNDDETKSDKKSDGCAMILI